MKSICRLFGLAIVAGALVGCGEDAAPDMETTATADNPQAGLDAIKNMTSPKDLKKQVETTGGGAELADDKAEEKAEEK